MDFNELVKLNKQIDIDNIIKGMVVTDGNATDKAIIKYLLTFNSLQVKSL